MLSGNIKWASSDNKIACVSNGIIIGIGTGKCQVIFSSNDGEFTAICDVMVLPKSNTSPTESVANLSGTKSTNIWANEYRVWANVIDGYLTELSDGWLDRIENIGNSVIVKTYDADNFSILDSKEITSKFIFSVDFSVVKIIISLFMETIILTATVQCKF